MGGNGISYDQWRHRLGWNVQRSTTAGRVLCMEDRISRCKRRTKAGFRKCHADPVTTSRIYAAAPLGRAAEIVGGVSRKIFLMRVSGMINREGSFLNDSLKAWIARCSR